MGIMARWRGRRMTKRLLRRLYECQHVDIALPAPSIIELKFILRGSRYCRRVLIVDDGVFDPPLLVEARSIPNFLLSQFEAQNLVEKSVPEILLTPVLWFLWQYAIYPGCEHEKQYPTLFTWHSTRTHRTYVAFAHFNFKMESRRYDISELLALKTESVSVPLLRKFEQDAELADYLRPRSDTSGPPRRAKKTSDNSSSDGPVQPPSKNMIGAANRPPPSDTQWKYRGRDGSEAVPSEPVPAPSGLSAQQNEGFQRFYKAVVSPTHVRVTAGGRIVPNTRGSSPTAKSVKDKPATEGEPSAAPGHENKPSTSKPALQPAPPIYPATAAAAARMLPPFVPPMSLLPLAYPYGLPPGYPLPHPALAAAQAHQQSLAQAASVKESQAIIAGADGNVDEKIGGIKLSHPDQFDYTRPFLYNGQLIFPPPLAYAQQLASPYLPVNWLGGAGLPAGVLPPAAPGLAGLHGLAAVPGVPGQAGVSGMANPWAFQPPYMAQPSTAVPGQMPQATGGLAAAAQHLAGQAQQQPHGPVAPPISSIRPSEITKKQLDSLRSALKYYEDQLQYNKHQIDEKHIEHQAQTVRAYINSFERTLKTQLATEEAMYPKSEKGSEGNGSSNPRSAAASKSSSSSENAGNSNSEEGTKPTDGQRARQQKMGINPPKPFGSSAIPGNGQLAKDDARAFKIPSHAALAQPFQPQGASYLSGQKGSVEVDEFYQDIQQPQEEVEKRLLAAASGFWGSTYPPTTPKNKAEGSDDTVVTTIQTAPHVSHTLAPNAPSMGAPSAAPKHVPQAANGSSSQQPRKGWEPGRPGHPDVPYLVGTLPKGVDPRRAKDTDYVYNRELTPDEICARHLYWGKAPRSVTQGLPKFDGKHFYPASPAKESPPPSPPPKFHGRDNSIPVGCHADSRNPPPRKFTVVDPFTLDESKMWKDGLGPVSLGLPNAADLTAQQSAIVAAHEAAMAPPRSPCSPDSEHRRPSDAAEHRSQSEHGPSSGSTDGSSANSQDYSYREGHEGSSLTSESKDSDLSVGHGSNGEVKSPNSARRREKRSTEKDKSGGFMSKGLWQNMFKRGSTAGNAVPGTVSSTMATGILPQFSSGHAAASLSPALGTSVPVVVLPVHGGAHGSRSTMSPNNSKSVDLGDGAGGGGAPLNLLGPGPVSSVSMKRGENLPPSTRASIDDDFAGMSIH